jgi:hypothetical protein
VTGPRLIEVGVSWLPETFLRRKFEGLVDRGFRVTVASPVASIDRDARVPGVDLLPLPAWDSSRLPFRARKALASLQEAS